MRKTINILWLEDDLQSTAHKSRTKIVGDILKKKGYEANIIPKGTFEEAKEQITQSLEDENAQMLFSSHLAKAWKNAKIFQFRAGKYRTLLCRRNTEFERL